jgi:hypothetical protein
MPEFAGGHVVCVRPILFTAFLVLFRVWLISPFKKEVEFLVPSVVIGRTASHPGLCVCKAARCLVCDRDHVRPSASLRCYSSLTKSLPIYLKQFYRICIFVQARTGKTRRMEAGGAFMLGGEQDCFGGCTDSMQAFYGLMDEVEF